MFSLNYWASILRLAVLDTKVTGVILVKYEMDSVLGKI
jgi:hypothetical protein